MPREFGPLQWLIAHCTWGASLSNRATISPRRATSRRDTPRTPGWSRTMLWDGKRDGKSAVMHEITGQVHWHEPSGFKRAGFGKFSRPKTPYDLFMESEDIPIYRDIGVGKVQNLPLKPWARMGGRGSYIQLHGTEGRWGSYIVEVPGAGALN